MKLAIIYSKTKLSGKLTKFWTGEYAYHCGFVDEGNDTFYDMNIMPRKVYWSAKNYKEFTLHDCILSLDDCENYLKQDSLKARYGVLDYCLFALRPLFHLFGKSTINANGVICSEMVNNWLWRKNANATPFNPLDAPPSPADFVRLYA
jgi:hypothetical protein